VKNENLMVFTGNANKDLAKKVASNLGLKLGKATVGNFSDGETMLELLENVRGKDVFILQSTSFPTNDNLMEIMVMVDALRRSSAARITAAIPYLGYSRQDRRPRSARVAITAKVVANMLTGVGVDRLLTMDLHSDQIQGFFEVPVDHLYASTLFLKEIEKLGSENMVIAAPDVGGAKRANSYSKKLDCGLALCHKHRKTANEIAEMTVIGEVEGKDVIIIDDMCDTAGTLTKAADLLIDKGARSVRAFCTHAVLSGPAYERINNSQITELIVTDTIPLNGKSDKIRVITVASLFSDVINKLIHNKSISSHFVIS
jgi:ribose-phosphate pyrophosphokinase